MIARRYPGWERREADAVYAFAIERGMSHPRAYSLACFASFGRKTWTQQKRIAGFTGYSIRTTQRSVRQGKQIGLLTTQRFPRGFQPEGGRGPLRCGGAWKTFIGWGLAVAAATALRLRYAVRDGFRAAARAELRASMPPVPA